jgi:hypothetical protein
MELLFLNPRIFPILWMSGDVVVCLRNLLIHQPW